ncbi:MAG: type II toxin-antitoxin system RelB/DinJ family antitoxin [Synergistaceae bacterium]|nr:type II toxin-antitoxin system RelB/DinJ family antitoxin [Synergistaceae bacterium]
MSTAAIVEVDAKLKSEAEKILDKIGLSFTQAVDLFTRQIVLRRAFPVELDTRESKPLCLEGLTEDELDAEIQRGIDDIKAGRTVSAEAVRKEMAERYGFKF